jgi:serine/threonine protein kinase
MATGERPFRGNTNLSVLASILKDVPRSISELRSDIPRPLARMIQRALEKRPEDRYQSAMDLRRDLEDLKRDVDTGELRVAAKGTRRAVATAHTRRRRLSPERPQADPDRSCARPVFGRTDLGHACQADSIVCLRGTSGVTVVAFVTDGPALRDVLDHLGLLRPGDQLAPSLSARTVPGPWMRWGES